MGTKTEITLIEVYQAQEEVDERGTNRPGKVFASYNEAARECSGWGGAPAPITHDAILVRDGSVRLLSEPMRLYGTADEARLDETLKKLTDRERKLLFDNGLRLPAGAKT